MNNINNSNKSSRSVACITGASSGIGREMAKLLSKKGYDLILVSRNTKEMLLLSQQLSTRCEIITCDLSDENACIKLGRTLANKDIYIFINNAGFGDLGSFDKTSLNKELSMINVNIKATHILTKYMVKAFKKRNRGYIMNVASSAGLLPGGPYMSTYYATKSYVTSLTSAIRKSSILPISGRSLKIPMRPSLTRKRLRSSRKSGPGKGGLPGWGKCPCSPACSTVQTAGAN